MKIKNKYITGTQIMFYEIELFPEYVDGIINTLNNIDNKDNITYDFTFNLSEAFEKIDVSKISKKELIDRFLNEIERLKSHGVNVKYKILEDDIPYSVSEYRRDFIYFNTNHYDYLIWGETDCFMPKETYFILEQISDYANKSNISKYVITFAIRKMWDPSWRVLEHVEFENCKYYEKTEPECFVTPSSIRYYMRIDEMNKINDKYKELDIRVLNKPQFDGSGAIFSSNLLKSGINIPLGSFGVAHEDSTMMEMCRKVMGNNYVQFVIKNILKVHNREHPKKRNYALQYNGENSLQSKKGDFYKKCKDANFINLQNIYQTSQNKFLTYDDCFKKIKNIEMVVARYKEDIKWLNNFTDIKCTVYNKFYNEINLLKNTGRESQTYLHHIVNNYDNLADYTIFTQGNPFDHAPNFIESIKNYILNPQKQFVYFGEKINKKLIESKFKHDKFTFNHDEHPTVYLIKNYTNINITPDVDYVEYACGALFAVSKESIHKKPKSFYYKLLNDPILELQTNVLPISPYNFERIWHYIFN